MSTARSEREEFLARLAFENRESYGTEVGRGTLRALDLVFEHRWVYFFELFQNAIDAGASSIGIRIADDGDSVVFRHDGRRPLEEGEVEALSKAFRSTKGATAVGFMGIGFKSVFGRFRQARVSGWGWKFRYRVETEVGERFGDLQPDLLGATIPIPDETIPDPGEGFTTRFELSDRADPGADLHSDLAKSLPEDDPAPLAILAAHGLRHLDMDGERWNLEVRSRSSDSAEVTVHSNGRRRRWRMFSVWFTPSDRAARRFVEHRRIRPGDQDAAAQRRRVLGLLPLAEDGTPAPPDRGGIYASLPTDATVPLGLHLHADWLLNISRTGFREIEDNEWQSEIADHIADLVAVCLRWGARSFSGVDAVRALFRALRPAKSSAGPESLLARKEWRSRLRAKLEDESVIPVWTADPERVVFRRPSEVSVMPPPLDEVASDCAGFRPDALFGRPVLRRDLLDSEAFALLDEAQVLRPLSPEALRREWAQGLGHWWETLPKKKSVRRRLLGYLWGALSRLDRSWGATELRVVRTAAKTWRSLEEAIFLREALPAAKEPGGKRVRRLLRGHVPSAGVQVSRGWTQVLRQGLRNPWQRFSAERDPALDWLEQAWGWVEVYGRSVTLKSLVKEAVDGFLASTPRGTGAMVSLGHWTRHRNRPKLLTQVVVGSGRESRIAPIAEALLAEPYLEDGAKRRRLFPEWPTVADAYLRKDPAGASESEWAAFLTRAGARNTPAVRERSDHHRSWLKDAAERRLGLEPGQLGAANYAGYEVSDFDIEPDLPDSSAPAERRSLLAEWLSEGYEALKGMGRLRCRYHYHRPFEQTGRVPAAWVSRLRELEWVPAGDGRLRCPAEVLPQPDASRPEAPAAELPAGLVRVLEDEGVRFGANIPEAPLLSRLAALGSRLGAAELAALLRECRERTLGADEETAFLRTVGNLEFPLDGRSERTPLCRIVRGGRRGALHGHIARFDDLEEPLRTELGHSLYGIPPTTTGAQALAFLREVWRRARTSPEGLANEVREALPTAYSYCLEDANEEPSLRERWDRAKGEAAVFAERRWIRLADGETVYLDDVDDRRFFPDGANFLTATAGHLGASPEAQKRTAEAIGLPLLSNSVEREWRGQNDRIPVDRRWAERYGFLYELLRRLRSKDPAAGAVPAGARGEHPGEHPTLARVRYLTLVVSLEGGAPRTVDVRARLLRSELLVAGEPRAFGADAAKELLRRFAFGQRAEVATDLAAMLFSLDSEAAFRDAAAQFREAHLPDFDLPPRFREREEVKESASGRRERKSRGGESALWRAGMERGTAADHRRPESRSSAMKSDHDRKGPRSGADGSRTPTPEGSGSYTRSRALARPNALAAELERSLKGEIVPARPDRTGEVGNDTPGRRSADSDDARYREAAARYERDCGRTPEDGAQSQVGWDLRSVDPESGAVRLIEVKGRRHPWTDEEVVELSRAQVLTGFRSSTSGEEGEWYLYVVERTEDSGYRVLPIRNPVEAAAKWIVRGGAWRLVAEDARTLPPE